MDGMTAEIERILAAKARRRRWLAALPYGEKVRAVIQMQRMVHPLLRLRDSRATVWELPEDGEK